MFEIQNAKTKGQRLAELCRFVEFWLGPRRPEYGVSEEELSEIEMPDPLRKLYQFAGRWPSTEEVSDEDPFLQTPFANQDCLRRFFHLQKSDDGKLIFLDENQGVWDCRTLLCGDDPPVWINGEYHERIDGEVHNCEGEKRFSESLTDFLTTYVLSELAACSKHGSVDKALMNMFRENKDKATPLWLDGFYVEDRRYSFYLFNELLVTEREGSYSFGGNTESAIAFIRQHLSPIDNITITLGVRWHLDISKDGSGWFSVYENASSPGHFNSGTFDFEDVLKQAQSLKTHTGKFLTTPKALFSRDRNYDEMETGFVNDWNFVRQLFHQAAKSIKSNSWDPQLKIFFDREWNSNEPNLEELFKIPDHFPEIFKKKAQSR